MKRANITLMKTLLLLAGLQVASTASAQSMEFQQRTVDATTNHIPLVVNANGWVAGPHEIHSGYYWDAIAVRPTDVFPGNDDPIISGLNSANDYTGYGADFFTGYEGSLSGSKNVMQPCGSAFPSVGLDLSETGIVAGFAPCPGSQATAFLWDSVGQQSLSIVGLSSTDSAFLDVSPSGQYAAGWTGTLTSAYGAPTNYYSDGVYGKHLYGSAAATDAVRYNITSQSLESLTTNIVGIPTGYTVIATTAEGVNDNGAVVGYATIQQGTFIEERPVLWTNPQAGWMIPMTGLSSQGCRARAINSSWQVVGTCYNDHSGFPTAEAFIWDVTRGTRILESVTTNSTHGYVEATDINDLGQITVGLDTNVTVGFGDPGSALLTPIGTPHGQCIVSGNTCYMMYENQCAGHAGNFNPNMACAQHPPIELRGE